MATLAPFGLAVSQSVAGPVREYIIRQADTNAYAVGDPVKSTSVVFQGRLPDGRPTSGLWGVTKAASGDLIRGVIVGVAGGATLSDSSTIPATKTRDYVVLVNDRPETVYEIQANNTALLGTLDGYYADFAVGSSSGSVSPIYLDSSTISATAGDLRIHSIAENQGANSTLRVTFAHHEEDQRLTSNYITSLKASIPDDGSVFALSEAVAVVALTATGTAFTGACEFRGIAVRAISGTPQTVTVYDATSATGTAIAVFTIAALGTYYWDGDWVTVGVGAGGRRINSTGCHVVISGGTSRTIDVMVE